MAGYTQITIAGQPIGLLFGLPAIKQISDKINLLSGMEEITLNIMSMVHILYAGYVNNCLANNQEPIIDFKVFYDKVEQGALNNGLAEIEKAIKVFAGSKEVKQVEEEGKKKLSKNKLIGTKLKRSA